MVMGASVAVNGACLTVVKKLPGAFTVDVSPETLACTNLSTLKRGSLVNLEQPMRLNERLGGHLVTGHVDGVGTITAIEKQGEFTIFTFQVANDLGRLLVPKGRWQWTALVSRSISAGARIFPWRLFPSPCSTLICRVARVGDKVNIETDLIGKYVHSFLAKRG